ncbi:hypothetical protein [Flavihumibacter petaseus]|uniref:DUF4595 domain-containing protein n=1 Tax=Flavihumibacter petaseus NBRC 106054 TaxID=1220578 RepID=A0A0E9N530_9BACT|nr:hypothetical protein [Flavihumibacter petaseus]GAO44898.1 hypothetical protein FPE01S_04_01410 [Flavihumibacter petaseus NBRC 106054]
MNRNFTLGIYLPALVLLTAFFSCSRENDPGPRNPDQPPPVNGKLLRFLTWSEGVEATAALHYSEDSALQYIAYVTPAQYKDTTFFDYGEAGVQTIWNKRSGEIAEYIYYPSGKVKDALLSDYWTTAFTQLHYNYAGNGKLADLTYYRVTDGQKKLQWRSVYFYGNDQLPTHIVSTDFNNHSIRYDFEAYTPACSYNPFVLIQTTDLAPLYEIYNQPFLQELGGRLPAKINKSAGGQVEMIIENTYTMNDRHPVKSEVRTSYPGHPEYNGGYNLDFAY